MNLSSFLNFKEKEKLPMISGAIACASGILTVILFNLTIDPEFTKNMTEIYHQNVYVTVAYIFGIVLSGCAIVFDLKLIKYMSFVAYLFGFINYVVFELDYLGSIFSSIDPTAITAEFIIIIVMSIVAITSALFSGIVKKLPEDEQ